MNNDLKDHRTAPAASLAVLEQRASLLRELREFFYERDFLEVETPLISREIIPEVHIEPIRTELGEFLQASPELFMKRLLAAGAQAIFQVTRSFRDGERGQLHSPEFTIVEWYRAHDSMQAGMDLLDELIQTLLGTPLCARTTYADAFKRAIGLCPHTAIMDHLVAATSSMAGDWDRASASPQKTSRDELLNLLLATRVEPQLGRDRPEIIYHYPSSQASLSKVVNTEFGYDVAERFELYYHGIELANGFHELTDAAEQRRRFEQVNAARAANGRAPLPLPETLLAGLEHGLPDCTGVALGFDRLAMLAVGAHVISDVMAF
jgi:elongation factor P--(R)-beta-lysine ligase